MHDAHLMSAIRGQAARLDNRAAHPRLCVVADVDPDNHLLRVILKPGSALSGWMPYGAIGVGAVKISAPPSPGDQAQVTFLHGDSQSGVVHGLLYSTQSPPARSPFSGRAAQPGELLITGANGAALHLGLDGSWRIQGDMHVTGNLTVTPHFSAAHGSLDRLRGHYNQHAHTDTRGDRDVSMDSPDAE